MTNTVYSKIALTLFVVGLFAYLVYPTYHWYDLGAEGREALKTSDRGAYDDLSKKAIKLGLDLQGGMHVVMEVDVESLFDKLAKNKDARFNEALAASAKESREDDANMVTALDRNLTAAGADLMLYYGDRERRSKEDVITFLQEQKIESIDRSLEILRNRIDEFGVSEPIIQKQGNTRIMIELAGVTSRERVLELIGKTAKLEFRMLKEQQVAFRAASRINDFLTGQVDSTADGSEDSAGDIAEEVNESTDTTAQVSGEDLFGDSSSDSAATDATADEVDIDASLFAFTQTGIFVHFKNIDRFKEMVNSTDEVKNIINQEAGRSVFMLGKTPIDISSQPEENRYIPVFMVTGQSDLDGNTIVDASRSRSSLDDLGSTGWEANIRFNNEGRETFSRLTGANIGKQMAIILDNRVQSAPTIQSKISQGRARITNLDTAEEAEDLAVVLKAGALPTASEIIEERTVGPSLGQDSVTSGTWSALIGLAFVAVFMLIYYRFGGFVANIALVLNIFILVGVMAGFGFTLTLPGIAGIILTIGMAVDANVLIFERIREELDKGKSAWHALDEGYGKAFITILDANVTTFIAGVVLFNFGSGPVRGFAVTLMIGILASMFTAIFVTRTIFEFLLTKKYIKELSV
ncbi:MAG: protein translocase subunit SecD [Calditrichia bacterium]